MTSPPQKAHPHLGPILIWTKGTLVPGARTRAFQLYPCTTGLEARSSPRGPPDPPAVASVARGAPRNVDGAGHAYGTRGNRVMSYFGGRRYRNIFPRDGDVRCLFLDACENQFFLFLYMFMLLVANF
ncbi:hypothetical protein VNO78_09163 [Psophocarpus tetragonolobus]|uniref:Uncharacterized protein n=1 Tax=Psophocarpus tetragonolobus TaxID=3891 RepID=A0AAN9XTF5_PSOTE